MNLGENRIGMRIPQSAWFLAISVSRIPMPFLTEFITASKLVQPLGRVRRATRSLYRRLSPSR
jgi:hypothetical protein